MSVGKANVKPSVRGVKTGTRRKAKSNTAAKSEQHKVRLVSASLWGLNLKRETASNADETVNIDVTMGLGCFRPAPDQVGVDFKVEAATQAGISIAASYRAIFELDAISPPPTEKELNSRLRHIAARVAPSILYPYLREAVSNIAARSGYPGFVLPILNLQEQFDIEEIVVPQWGSEEG